jgi:hypothetical protein
VKIILGFISNSSSEAFIISNRGNLKRVENELSEILEVYNRIKGGEHQLSYNEVFRKPSIGENNDVLNLRGYSDNITSKDIINKVIVYSKWDNSIPWAIIAFIEDTYNCRRLHLG